jgi:hypothetical protein
MGKKIKERKEIIPKIPVVEKTSRNLEAELKNLTFQKIELFRAVPLFFKN